MVLVEGIVICSHTVSCRAYIIRTGEIENALASVVDEVLHKEEG